MPFAMLRANTSRIKMFCVRPFCNVTWVIWIRNAQRVHWAYWAPRPKLFFSFHRF